MVIFYLVLFLFCYFFVSLCRLQIVVNLPSLRPQPSASELSSRVGMPQSSSPWRSSSPPPEMNIPVVTWARCMPLMTTLMTNSRIACLLLPLPPPLPPPPPLHRTFSLCPPLMGDFWPHVAWTRAITRSMYLSAMGALLLLPASTCTCVRPLAGCLSRPLSCVSHPSPPKSSSPPTGGTSKRPCEARQAPVAVTSTSSASKPRSQTQTLTRTGT